MHDIKRTNLFSHHSNISIFRCLISVSFELSIFQFSNTSNLSLSQSQILCILFGRVQYAKGRFKRYLKNRRALKAGGKAAREASNFSRNRAARYAHREINVK